MRNPNPTGGGGGIWSKTAHRALAIVSPNSHTMAIATLLSRRVERSRACTRRAIILQISSNFALAQSLSANQGREIAQNRNIDPRDSVVKDLTASRWSKHRDGSWRSRLRARGNAVPANVFGRIEKHLFRALFVEPSMHTDTKKTNWPMVGRMCKGSGWEGS